MERDVLQRIHAALERGQPARALGYTIQERAAIQGMGLLTLKPVMYALNVDEVDFTLGRAQAVERIEKEILPHLNNWHQDGNQDENDKNDEKESTTTTRSVLAQGQTNSTNTSQLWVYLESGSLQMKQEIRDG